MRPQMHHHIHLMTTKLCFFLLLYSSAAFADGTSRCTEISKNFELERLQLKTSESAQNHFLERLGEVVRTYVEEYKNNPSNYCLVVIKNLIFRDAMSSEYIIGLKLIDQIAQESLSTYFAISDLESQIQVNFENIKSQIQINEYVSRVEKMERTADWTLLATGLMSLNNSSYIPLYLKQYRLLILPILAGVGSMELTNLVEHMKKTKTPIPPAYFFSYVPNESLNLKAGENALFVDKLALGSAIGVGEWLLQTPLIKTKGAILLITAAIALTDRFVKWSSGKLEEKSLKNSIHDSLEKLEMIYTQNNPIETSQAAKEFTNTVIQLSSFYNVECVDSYHKYKSEEDQISGSNLSSAEKLQSEKEYMIKKFLPHVINAINKREIPIDTDSRRYQVRQKLLNSKSEIHTLDDIEKENTPLDEFEKLDATLLFKRFEKLGGGNFPDYLISLNTSSDEAFALELKNDKIRNHPYHVLFQAASYLRNIDKKQILGKYIQFLVYLENKWLENEADWISTLMEEPSGQGGK